jgi:4-phospho-D-threonate 3-dehydrogenase / 4-phospho-D-erythronate 3-dehydrogenase
MGTPESPLATSRNLNLNLNPKSPLLALAIGDVTGVGPEVTLKAIAAPADGDRATRYLLVGDEALLTRTRDQLGLSISWEPFRNRAAAGPVCLLDPGRPLAANLPAGCAEAANAALSYLTTGAKLCQSGEANALVTAPVNKEAIIKAGHRFVGQTEFLSALAGAKRTAMMLLGRDERGRWIRVVLATTHVPLRRVADELTTGQIELAIDLAGEACRLLDLPRARIAVCGLNPHAGEGGKLGTEEHNVIAPAVRRASHKGLDVHGPLPADTVFHQALHGSFDVIVAMYHDQGLTPLKMIAFETGVNWTLGLPFIRTSPDHGTAYDIAGKGIASPSSMISAIRLARQLAAH